MGRAPVRCHELVPSGRRPERYPQPDSLVGQQRLQYAVPGQEREVNRRAFLASLACSFRIAAEEGTPMIRPHAMKTGDTVGLITPSTFVSDPDALATAERTVQYFGLNARWGRNVRKKSGYLGGTVQERVDDLHAMFRDAEVKAVFC